MTAPIASVVVPAHDEEASIATTLRVLLDDARSGEFEVVVVCNGCTDSTAERARSVAGVEVIELDVASKIAALREGDRHASVFPRIYLDGDTRLTTAAARALVRALAAEHVRVAGLRAELDLSAATRPARWYHEFRHELPVFSEGIIGAGVYALDRDASERLGAWPDVLGDDQYVLRSFAPEERATVREHRTLVALEGGLGDVVRRAIRIRRGNRDLDRGVGGASLPAPPSGAPTLLRRTLRRPERWAGALLWLGVGAWVRLRTRAGHPGGDWDASTLPRSSEVAP